MRNRNARIGLVLFGVYAAFYAAFVLVSALATDLLDATPFAGLNLAILSGFGLILLAFVLSLVYGVLAGDAAADDASTNDVASPDGAPR